MPDRGGFSIASVVLSYFLVAGGIAAALIALSQIKQDDQAVFYAMIGAGGALGGFVAGRASRGETILEPAIGALLVIATMVGVFIGTGAGKFMWHVAQEEITKLVGISGGAAAVGALIGAGISEKMFGAHSQHSLVWLIYVTFAAAGASFVAFVVLLGAMLRGTSDQELQAATWFSALGAGALLSGIAAGASAPKRILIVSLLGSVIAMMGLFLLIRELPGMAKSAEEERDAALGFAVIGVGCGVVTLIGSLIGWKAVGQRHAA